MTCRNVHITDDQSDLIAIEYRRLRVAAWNVRLIDTM